MPKTTNTLAFNLSLNEIIEEAYERCGSELRSGYDFRTARRSLSLMMLDWSSRGINLWTVDSDTIPLVAGTSTYDLPVDTVDLLDHVIRTGTGTGQTDIQISRISGTTYSMIPAKNITGRPIQVWVNRQSGAQNSDSTIQYPQITVWPVPDSSTTYTFVYWRLRRMFDPGNGVNAQDVPFRFLPCLVSGLAYYLAMKLPEGGQRLQTLKAIYDEDWQRAADEDREKAPLRLVPRVAYR